MRASFVWMCVCVPMTAVTRPSSQVASRDLLARRLGVEVDDDNRRRGACLVDERVDHLPRRDRGRQEELAQQIDHGDDDAVARLDDRHPVSGRFGSGVRGPDHALAGREVGGDAAATVGVVAERDDVGAGGEQLVGELAGDAGSVGGVLSVDDREVGVVALAEAREVLLHGAGDPGRRRRPRERGSSRDSV